MSPWRVGTRLVHVGRPPRLPGGPVNPPVTMSSTFHQGGAVSYGRDGNPTWEAFESAIGDLEGGDAVAFASGMGAIAAVLEMIPVPGRVVVAGDAYNGTRRFLTDVAGRGRLRFRTVSIANTEATLSACAEMVAGPSRPSGDGFGAGGVLWLESPTNPLLAVADLPALFSGAHDLGLDVVVDNTFATPLLQRPLQSGASGGADGASGGAAEAGGADVVVHSATKLLAGHSDVLMGVAVTRRPEVLEALRTRRSLHGAIPAPLDTWLALRGLRTLEVRLERSQASAGELARRLVGRRGISRVRYPGLVDDPGHARASAQMDGFGTIVSFEVEVPGMTDADAAEAVVAAVQVATAGTSLGGVETLIERRGRWALEHGLPPGLVRLSLGIENLEDLWEDLDRAIGQVAGS